MYMFREKKPMRRSFMSAAEQTHDVYQLLVFREPTVDSEITNVGSADSNCQTKNSRHDAQLLSAFCFPRGNYVIVA